MSSSHEPGGPRDSLVRATFAPDTAHSAPDDPARLGLVLDNHDTVGRLVRVELSGPLARYTKPRRQPRLDLQARRQHEITLEVRPEETRPEGGHAYDLHAVVIDDKLETVLYTCAARVGVERSPQLATRAEKSSPARVKDRGVVQLRVHVRNSGNVPLLVDAQRVNHQLWVRDHDRRKDEKLREARRVVRSERKTPPRTPERLRPRQSHDFDLLAEPPAYLVGFGPRRWWVPVGIRSNDLDPECVFADFVQEPRIVVERRMAVLAGAVAVALLVLVGFMVALAT